MASLSMASLLATISQRLFPSTPSVQKDTQAAAYGLVPQVVTSLRDDVLGQPVDVDYALLYAIYNLNTDVSGAIDRWIGVVTGNGWRIAPMDPGLEPGEKLQTEIDQITTWLKKPNPSKPFSLLSQEGIMHLGIAGGYYWQIIKDSSKRPSEIWPIHPSTIRVVADEHGVILGYVQRVNGKKVAEFEPDQICNPRLPNPRHDLYGQSPLERALEEIKTDLKAVRSNQAMFDNGMAPSAIALLDKSLGDDAVRKLMAEIKRQHIGSGNRHKLFAAQGITDLKTWASTLKDMEFIALRGLSTEKVATAYGVPKLFLNQKDAADYATSDVLERQLYYGKGKPLQELTAEAITESIIHAFNPSLRFVWNTPEFGNPDQLRTDAISAYTAGIVTKDEVRERFFALPKIEDDSTAPSDTQERCTDEATDAPTDTSTDGSDTADTSNETEQPAAKRISKETSDWSQISADRETEKDRLVDGFTSPVVAYFASQEQRYLTKLSSGAFQLTKARIPRATDATGEDANPELDDFVQDPQADGLLDAVFAANLPSSLSAGAQAAQLQINFTLRFDQLNPIVQRYLQTDALTHVQAINETTRQSLRDALAQGIQEGEGIADLSKRIQSIFTAAKSSRATLIARNETAQAFEYANQEAALATGLDLVRVWTVSSDERLCLICAPLAGSRTPINEPFPQGEPGSIHVSCRCTSVYEAAE